MDFVHANMRAPWGFVRDTDANWNLKVLAEETHFPEWQIREEDFRDDRFFGRLKEWGFAERDDLVTFLGLLADAVSMTDYEKDAMVTLLNTHGTPAGDEFTVDDLERLGLDWMRDTAEFVNLGHWKDAQDDARTDWDRRVREFRHDHDWVVSNLTGEDELDYVYPTDGTVLYYGYRASEEAGEEAGEELLFAGNMEGVEETVTPASLVDVAPEGWDVALATPGVDVAAVDDPVTLADSDAAIFIRD